MTAPADRTGHAPAPTVFATDPRAFFQHGFEQIHATRLRGLPIVNERLHVHVLPFRRCGGLWISTVLTPWSVLAVAVCADPALWPDSGQAAQVQLSLPSGTYDFLSVTDTLLGRYLMCPLHSPVHDLADQTTAEALAAMALRVLLEPGQSLTVWEQANSGTDAVRSAPAAQRSTQGKRAFVHDFLRRAG